MSAGLIIGVLGTDAIQSNIKRIKGLVVMIEFWTNMIFEYFENQIFGIIGVAFRYGIRATGQYCGGGDECKQT